MTDEAKAARREYERQWRANNPDKIKAKNHRYWEKRAAAKKHEIGGDHVAEDKAN